MNGRVYDAKLGRFASADPHIQAPHNTQSYNRYTYVLNNPLKYADPSGFFFKKIFKALGITKLLSILPAELLMVASIAAAVLLGPGGAWAIQGLSTITQGAIAGAVSGFIGSGGDLKAAVVGGLTGAAFAGIGDKFAKFKDLDTVQKMEKIALHGLTGGASSVANGGKFGAGFMSAGFTQAMSVSGGFEKLGAIENAVEAGDRAKNAIVAGMVGRTASVIGGGKFSNGAQSAAMSRMFNDVAHSKARMEARRSGKSTVGHDIDRGVKDGVKSLGVGVGRAIRYLGRSFGVLGKDEFYEARAEGHIMDEVISEAGKQVAQDPSLVESQKGSNRLFNNIRSATFFKCLDQND